VADLRGLKMRIPGLAGRVYAALGVDVRLLPGGVTADIVFMLLLIFVLGFFLEWIEISYIAVPLFLPIFAAAGVDPVRLAMLITVMLQTSFLTPPFGWALFFLKGVAPPQVTTRHLYPGVLPFVGLQIVGVALVFAYPGIATWLPKAIGWKGDRARVRR
jgi:TRAP-type mannitol/chloroaromatic compound transport system permease large subunit